MTPAVFIQAALDIAEPLIAGLEAFRPRPYRDIIGDWTFAYGNRTTLTGAPVTAHTPACSPAEGRQLLGVTLRQISQALERHVLRAANPHQVAAVLSITYNIGSGDFCGSSILRAMNAGNWTAAAQDFLLYDYAGGKPVVALEVRRERERLVFLHLASDAAGIVPAIHPRASLAPRAAPRPPAPRTPAPQPSADELMAAELNRLGAA